MFVCLFVCLFVFQAQIANLQKDLALAKQAGDSECVARVELESLVAVNIMITVMVIVFVIVQMRRQTVT